MSTCIHQAVVQFNEFRRVGQHLRLEFRGHVGAKHRFGGCLVQLLVRVALGRIKRWRGVGEQAPVVQAIHLSIQVQEKKV